MAREEAVLGDVSLVTRLCWLVDENRVHEFSVFHWFSDKARFRRKSPTRHEHENNARWRYEKPRPKFFSPKTTTANVLRVDVNHVAVAGRIRIALLFRLVVPERLRLSSEPCPCLSLGQ